MRIELFIFPTVCKSSVRQKCAAAQVQTITGASVLLLESDSERVLSRFENRARPLRSHLLSPLRVRCGSIEDNLNHCYCLFPNCRLTVELGRLHYMTGKTGGRES